MQENAHAICGDLTLMIQQGIQKLLCLVALLSLPMMGWTQPLAWYLITEDDSLLWEDHPSWPADSIDAAIYQALAQLHKDGYFFAHMDSQSVGPAKGVLYVTRGERAVVGDVAVVGVPALNNETFFSPLPSRQGDPFDIDTVEQDVNTLLDYCAALGFHFARVSVGRQVVHSPAVDLTFFVDAGGRPVLGGVLLVGAKRTSSTFARRMLGYRLGHPVIGFRPNDVIKRFADVEVFRAVGSPTVALGRDSLLILQIPVTEAPPGFFDLAFGYERDGEGRGALVGSGQLALRNLFGHGRTMTMELNRAPGQLSTIGIHVRDPFVLGLPVAVAANFEGLQQDSTFGKQVYGLELGVRFEERMHVYGTTSREVIRPGLSGIAIEGGRQRIPVADALFFGLGLRIRTVDSRLNPRSGLTAETSVERGSKDQTLRVVQADTTSEQSRISQSRLRVRMRYYIPMARRQAIVLGGETLLLRSSTLDESDLFRFGGANTLRGYDEQRFRAPFVSRALVEYRYLLDSISHALLFFDLGYVDASRTTSGLQGFFSGFGVGFQLDTEAGLITVTAASSTEAPSEVRIHLGVSLGL